MIDRSDAAAKLSAANRAVGRLEVYYDLDHAIIELCHEDVRVALDAMAELLAEEDTHE